MIDLLLLRIMKHRRDFSMLYPLVKSSAIEETTKALINDFNTYFAAFPSHDRIDLTTFITRFKAWHPTITDDRLREFARIMQNAMTEPDEDQRAVVLQELADNDVTVKLANLVEAIKEGDVADIPGEVTRIYDDYKFNRAVKQVRFIDTPINELLQDEFNDAGVAWRLHCLNRAMRKLRGGDFLVIAGRPDKGKTSFIASETSFMAPQLPPDRNVVWLNNEGPGKRIIPRVWQAALNLTMNEMKALAAEDRLEEQFLQVMGRFDKIRVIDIHGMSNSQVEVQIEQNNPGIIIYDMIDNIGGFGDASRTDQKLEQMYQWARERSVKYDSIGLATSQISADGDGMRFPEQHMLKDSKTGKQGACDAIVTVGAISDPNSQGLRFIGTPKNKMRRPDGPADPRAEVIFDALRSRYKDTPLNPLDKEEA